MSDTFGKAVCLTLAGESHGKAITAILSGIFPGVRVDEEAISCALSKRMGLPEISTGRREPDEFEILSGVKDGKSTGGAITILIPNRDVKDRDYSALSGIARPGHADYAAFCKYGGYNITEGGGALSGRLTAGIVAAGTIAREALKTKGIEIACHIKNIGDISDRPFENLREDLKKLEESDFAVLCEDRKNLMIEAIQKAKTEGDSLGGGAECIVTGLPAGLGDPFFDSVESMLSHLLFSIPAVKAVEFGSGKEFESLTGSQANDEFILEDGTIQTKTNHNGGVNGGITNGMPLLFSCSVKPTPSILKEQHTVNFLKMEETDVCVCGRHDPAIISRIPVILESAAALVLCDFMERRYGETCFSPEGKI